MFARGFVGWGKPGATEYGVPPLARLRRVSLRQNCSIESPDFVAVHESAYGRKADIAPTGLLAYVLTEALQFDVSGGKIMAQKLSGGCACGAIHYECSADPVLMLNCHCRDCQQASGSAYAAIVVVSKTALQIRGEPRYHKVRADGHASFRNGWFYPGDRGSRMSCLLLCRSPPFPDAESQSKDVKEAARVLGQQVHVINASSEGDLDTAFTTLVQLRAGGLLVTVDPFLNSHRDQLVALAARHKIPTMYFEREFVLAGGLVSYAPNLEDGYRQAGVYAGRILKGEKPADLPVLQPTKFEFVINLKAAKAMRLEIPPKLLALTDEVIE